MTWVAGGSGAFALACAVVVLWIVTGLAVQLKLNEVVAALKGASNRLIDVEELGEAELQTLRAHYQHLVGLAKADGDLTESHSVEEAEQRHEEKQISAG